MKLFKISISSTKSLSLQGEDVELIFASSAVRERRRDCGKATVSLGSRCTV